MDWGTLRCSLFCKDFHVIIRRHVAAQERERETKGDNLLVLLLVRGRSGHQEGGVGSQWGEQPKQESKQTRSEAGSQNKRRQDIAPVTPTKGSAKAALESHSCVRQLQVASGSSSNNNCRLHLLFIKLTFIAIWNLQFHNRRFAF